MARVHSDRMETPIDPRRIRQAALQQADRALRRLQHELQDLHQHHRPGCDEGGEAISRLVESLNQLHHELERVDREAT